MIRKAARHFPMLVLSAELTVARAFVVFISNNPRVSFSNPRNPDDIFRHMVVLHARPW